MSREREVVLLVGGGAKDSIGERIVQELAPYYDLVVFDRVNEWIDSSEYLHVQYVDLLSYEHIEYAVGALARYLKQNAKSLHAWVYAAGYNEMGDVKRYSVRDWETTVQLNAGAVWMLTQHLLREEERHDGFPILKTPTRAVILGSNTAYVAKTRTFAYGFAKAGLVHMLRCLHRELAREGKMEFVSLDFGIVLDSGMTRHTIEQLREQRGWDKDRSLEMLLANVPNHKPVTRSEIAQWVRFLLSVQEFSVGGSSIRLDSGQQQG